MRGSESACYSFVVVYASGSKRQNTRNVSGRRCLNGAKFWRNRYVGKSNSDRARSRRRGWAKLAMVPAYVFTDRDRDRWVGEADRLGRVDRYVSHEEARERSEMRSGEDPKPDSRTALSKRL